MVDEQYDKDKYKALYEFQLKGLDNVKDLYHKLEDKASKYLAFVSVIIGTLTIFSRQYLFDNSNKGFLYFLIIFLIFLVFLSLCCIARNLFQVLETTKVGRLDNNFEMIKFFHENELSTVYYNLAKDIAEIVKIYNEKNEEKVKYLRNAFSEVKFCGLMFVFIIILILIDNLLVLK